MKISKEQKKKINEIGKKFNLTMVLIFGSQIKGSIHLESDLDIAVLDYARESYSRYKQFFSAFSKVFRSYNVDLRFIKDAEPIFFYQVFHNSQLIYGKEEDYYLYKAYAYKNYVDSQSLFKLRDKIILRKQKELKRLYD